MPIDIGIYIYVYMFMLLSGCGLAESVHFARNDIDGCVSWIS